MDTDPTASSTPTHVVFMLKLGTHRPNFIVITRNIWSPCASHVAAMFVTTVSFFSLAMSFGPKTSSPEPSAPSTKSHSGTSKQAVADDHTHTCTRFGSVKFSSMRMATPAAPPVPENHPVRNAPGGSEDCCGGGADVGSDVGSDGEEDDVDTRRRVRDAAYDLAEPGAADNEAMMFV